jgi:hypothetical protein
MNQFPSSSITSVIDAPVSETSTFLAPPWIRLGARLFAASLDQKLASGEHPAASHLLASRAQQLIAAHYRRGIADSWLDLLIEVRRPRVPFDPAVLLARNSVMQAETQIRSLAEALVGPLPTVRGTAMAIAMLRDGAGPLFNRNSQLKLTDAVEQIIAQLNPLATATTL